MLPSVPLRLAVLSTLCCYILAEPCKPTRYLRSGSSDQPAEIQFLNNVNEEYELYWVHVQGWEQDAGILDPKGEMSQQSFIGHAFRVRRVSVSGDGELVGEFQITKPKQIFEINECGAGKRPPENFANRHEEFTALSQHHVTPCDPEVPSSKWSCYRCISGTEFAARPKQLYGFTPEEARLAHQTEGKTVDTSYVRQIPFIRHLTNGPGYLRMNMTDKMKQALLPWYAGKKAEGQIKFDEVVEGGYTNSDKTPFGKIDMDRYPKVRSKIVAEMTQVLQWWTNQSLRHTATYGVRVYPRDAILINHVDREDTHLASAVLQVAQQVDEDGGWPLEVLQPDGNPCEVYLQPGEMVLYEGAWVKHGRPMRFKGTEFANVFSHYKPRNWSGTSELQQKARANGEL